MLKNLPIVHILWYVKVGIWSISADSPAFFRMAESAALLPTYFNLRPTYLPTGLYAKECAPLRRARSLIST
jgi:hypothetical protein